MDLYIFSHSQYLKSTLKIVSTYCKKYPSMLDIYRSFFATFVF